ncbi:hypothetical protein PR261_00755 [Metamycoplasma hyosynoviae]|uniref:MAG3240 family lipoprotein n=1 Tax=Metamycoplasma hyosynoviae TaxID=29559 RepID=UPI0023589743|nr:hypothetical protein [Metamycoplasma hyosynoviae]MDC8917581.1 hypothetical protein [Metamycoplasma hyosynoviae]MDD7912590.1 hypothetical protein [Metamycoplasma hyosynoviae]
MTKKLMYSSIFSVLSFAPAVFSISCSQKNSYLDINKISRKYLKILSGNQIAIFHNQNKIFYFYEKGKRLYFQSAVFDDKKNEFKLFKDKNNFVIYKPDFTFKKTWYQQLNQFNSMNIIEGNEKTNISNILTEYPFESVDAANGFNDDWFLAMSQKLGFDFNRAGDPYFADLQTIIFKVIFDLNTNYNFLNSRRMVNVNNESVLKKTVFRPDFIQAKTWLDDAHEFEREVFKKYLVLYLNKFNVGVKDIIIDWKQAKAEESLSKETDFVSFKIKDIIDFNDKSIMPVEKLNNSYYINDFRKYDTDKKFGLGTTGIKSDELPLFNEYIPNPLLLINGENYLTVNDNINHFVKGALEYDFWNSKGLIYLFKNFINDFFEIKIPKHKQNEDILYKIIDFEYTPYLETNQILKAIVRVFKKDKSYKDYVWFSSNFDDHGHRLKGQIFKNKYYDSQSSSPENLTTEDIWNYTGLNKKIPKGISFKEFFNFQPVKKNEVSTEDINKVYTSVAFYKLLLKATNNLQDFKYWNNDIRQSYEASFLHTDSFQIKILASFINNYMLAYALNNEEEKLFTGVKRIDISVLPTPYEVGKIHLKLDFMSYAGENDYKYKTEGEKKLVSVYIYWNDFKGYEKKSDYKEIEIEKIVEGEE